MTRVVEVSASREDRIEAIQAQIERLMSRAESGEQWAEVCRLEDEMVSLRDPSPYCYGGHRGPKDCDCGPIADNE